MFLFEDAFDRSDKPLRLIHAEELIKMLIRKTLNHYRDAGQLYQSWEILESHARRNLQQSKTLLPLAGWVKLSAIRRATTGPSVIH